MSSTSTPGPAPDALELAALLCSRVCHDLISPVGAIVAGIALGSLSMRTKSIYQGFLVHITVAALMDWLSLAHRHALPTVLWPPG